MEWSGYFTPASLNKLVSRKWRFFVIPVIASYLYNFIFALLAANFYSDWDRKLSCVDGSFDVSEAAVEAASSVYDTVLVMLFLYHFIEWIRCALLATVMTVGTPVMVIWYGLGLLNVPFGLATFLYAHAVRFGEAGSMCAEHQVYRGKFLTIDIICFWVLFVFFSCPILMLRCMGRVNLDKTLAMKDSDEEEEEGDDKN